METSAKAATKKLRMAVVGVGALGRHHARILSEMSQVELVAVADSNPQRGREVADKVHTRWIPDYNELLENDVIDGVSIVVPTHAHRAVAGQFLERGIPVIVEKPLAASVAAAEELVEIAAQQGTLLQVGHIERFNPAFQTARRHVRAPKYIRCERTSTYTFRSTDIGVIHDLMIHDIDLVLSLVQSPLKRCEAFGVGVMGENEDAAQARLHFENGCIADLTASRISPTASRTMTIWSSSACVTVDLHQREVKGFVPSETLLYGTPPLERASRPGADLEALKKDVFGHFIKVESHPVDSTGADALTQELAEFVTCVKSGRTPLVDGRTALEAMIIAGEILDCVDNHQWDGHAFGAVGPYPRVVAAKQKAA